MLKGLCRFDLAKDLEEIILDDSSRSNVITRVLITGREEGLSVTMEAEIRVTWRHKAKNSGSL